MHGFSYDPIHDEIVVNSPLTQAILTFRGSVNGEEPPIRVIQGPKTKILGADTGALNTVTADPEHNEIFLPVGNNLVGKSGARRRADQDPASRRLRITAIIANTASISI